MSEAGYTATEALVALMILGMAVSGLIGGMKVIGLTQAAASRNLAQAVRERDAAGALGGLLQRRGPFRSDDDDGFAGDPRGFHFACGGGTCAAELTATGLSLTSPTSGRRLFPLARADRLGFRYLGSASEVAVWPPAPPPQPAPQWQTLRDVLVRDASGETVFVAPVVVQQRADCQYDGILQDCRKAGS